MNVVRVAEILDEDTLSHPISPHDGLLHFFDRQRDQARALAPPPNRKNTSIACGMLVT